MPNVICIKNYKIPAKEQPVDCKDAEFSPPMCASVCKNPCVIEVINENNGLKCECNALRDKLKKIHQAIEPIYKNCKAVVEFYDSVQQMFEEARS